MLSIEAHTNVPCPLELLASMLTRQPSDWLDPFLRIAAHLADAEGAALATKAGRKPPRETQPRAVEITLSPARGKIGPTTPRTTIPFRWDAHGYGTVFEALEGTMRIERRDEASSVAIEAHLTPPSWLGDPGGRVIARRTARDAAERFLGSLRSAFEEAARLPQAKGEDPHRPA